MNAHESISAPTAPLLVKADPNAPALIVTGPETISIKAGTSFAGKTFDADTRVLLPEKLEIGGDYYVSLDDDGCPHAELVKGSLQPSDFAGFHFAPGGNAQARAGGATESRSASASIDDLKKVMGHSEKTAVTGAVYDRAALEAHRRIAASRKAFRDKK